MFKILLHACGLALQFLTRLPTPKTLVYSPATAGWSVVFFPWVGLAIGALLSLARLGLGESSPLLQAAWLLMAWVLLTGGLHLDGLADCADAWVGGQGDRDKTLRIMKDPCSGPIAVAAVVLVLLLKFAALAEPASAWALLFAPVLGRVAIPVILLSTPYVRPQGLACALVDNLPRRAVGWSAALATVLAASMLGLRPLLAAALLVLGLRLLMLRRLGGSTGDTLGACVELVEALILAVGA